jgi:hypothetical protein
MKITQTLVLLWAIAFVPATRMVYGSEESTSLFSPTEASALILRLRYCSENQTVCEHFTLDAINIVEKRYRASLTDGALFSIDPTALRLVFEFPGSATGDLFALQTFLWKIGYSYASKNALEDPNDRVELWMHLIEFVIGTRNEVSKLLDQGVVLGEPIPMQNVVTSVGNETPIQKEIREQAELDARSEHWFQQSIFNRCSGLVTFYKGFQSSLAETIRTKLEEKDPSLMKALERLRLPQDPNQFLPDVQAGAAEE